MTDAAASGATNTGAPAKVTPSTNAQPAQPAKETKPPPETATDPTALFKGTKHKVKWDDQEAEVEYDELRKGYQLAASSTKRYQEAKKMVQQVQPIQEALERGDVDFIASRIGPDKAAQLFEDFLIKRMEYDAKPQVEKDLLNERQKREQLEATLRQREEAENKARADYMRQQAHEQIDKEVGEALQALGRKPTPRLVLRIADELLARMETDTPIDAKQAAQFAMQGLYSDMSEYLPQLDDETLLKVIPKSVQDRIRKHEVDRFLGDKATQRTKPSGTREAPKKFNIDEKFKQIEKRFMR